MTDLSCAICMLDGSVGFIEEAATIVLGTACCQTHAKHALELPHATQRRQHNDEAAQGPFFTQPFRETRPDDGA